MLGASACHYGPPEDKTSLGESKTERWKNEEAGRKEAIERQTASIILDCDMSRKEPFLG